MLGENTGFMDKLAVHSREGAGTLVLLTKYIGCEEKK